MRNAHRVIGHRNLLDPVGCDRGDAEASVRARRRTLRQPAAGPHRERRPRAPAGGRPLPRGERARRLDRCRGREDRGPRVRGHGARRVDDLQPRHPGHHDPRRRVRGAPGRAGGTRRRRPIRADGRWSRRVPGPAQGRRQALRENSVGDRVDDARPHDPRRRVVGARTRRGEHVSQALGVRQRGEPRCEDGNDRLQGLVPGSARRAHAVGRRGVRRVRHGRRERTRARDLARVDGGPADPRATQPRSRRDARRAGRTRATSSISSSTASWRSRSTATRSQRSGPARWSARRHFSKGVHGRPRSARKRGAGSESSRAT